MKHVRRSENTGTFSNNQEGFSVVETLMLLIIIVLIGAAGWLVYRDNKKTPTAIKVTTSTASSTTNTSSSAGPNQAQYAGWLSFCSSYGGLCLKYPSNWKLSQVSYTPGTSPTTGQEVNTITSPSTTVTVSYMPSALVTGSRRDETIKVVGVTATAISNLKVYKLIDQLSSSQYAVEDFVTLNSAAHALDTAATPFTAGAKIAAGAEPPYHQFTNPERPSDIGQQLLAVTISNGNAGNNIFTSNAAAQAWLTSAEVVTASQILDSVTYSQ